MGYQPLRPGRGLSGRRAFAPVSWEDEDERESLVAAAVVVGGGGGFAHSRLLLLLLLLLWRNAGWKDESRRRTMPEATIDSARQWT